MLIPGSHLHREVSISEDKPSSRRVKKGVREDPYFPPQNVSQKGITSGGACGQAVDDDRQAWEM